MSEEELSNTDEAPDAAAHDASMKVDSSSLSSEEADFARQMGFDGDDDEDSKDSSDVAETQSKPDDSDALEVATAEAVDAPDDSPNESASSDEKDHDVDEDNEAEPNESDDATQSVGDTVDDSADQKADTAPIPDDVPGDEDTTQETAKSESADFEEVHPRAATEGMQATLESRAVELLERNESAATPGSSAASHADTSALDERISSLESESQESQSKVAVLQEQLEERDAELVVLRTETDSDTHAAARFEKENDALQSDLDAISIDRDHLIDQLAVTSGKLVQSTSHCDRLEASLRAARGALTPLPEGERALRAEVIGLRGRIEEAGEEHQALAAELSANATELAIARARVEDRQHEVNAHVERVEELDEVMTRNQEKLATTIARHREMLAVSTRLQADNNELRSAQAALEETLQARDLEILAREEHLAVTREGLSARDAQLVDVNERLEQQRQRTEAQEAERQRSEIECDQHMEKIAHRESRIATLTDTLARIEEAMGHPIPVPDSAAREMPQAEWTRPVLAQHAIRPRVKRPDPFPSATLTEPPTSNEAESASVEDESETADPPPPSPDVQIEVESTSVEDIEIDTTESKDNHTEDETETCSSENILTPQPTLPAILSNWRDRRFSEVTGGVGPDSVHGFLAERLQKHLGEPGPEFVFLKSLGGSLPDAEVQLVQALGELGVDGIRMEVLDVDSAMADARRQKIELGGMGEVIDVVVGDLDDWDAQAPCHGILLSDALYAQPNAEAFLDHITGSLTDGALILFLDRIASGPVQLSASALIRLEELWDVLPESLANADGLSIVPHRGDDGGFASSNHDPAGMLLARFDPIVLAGFGHLADLVVGPTRGHALSVENDEAMNLLESIMTIDESRSLTEHLAPRHGLALFAHGSAGRTETIGQDWPSEPARK